jgi:hypothetical protein
MLVQISLNSQVSTATANIAVAAAKPKTIKEARAEVAAIKAELDIYKKKAKAESGLTVVRAQIEAVTYGHHSPKKKKDALVPLKAKRDKLREQMKTLQAQRKIHKTADGHKLLNLLTKAKHHLEVLKTLKGGLKKPAPSNAPAPVVPHPQKRGPTPVVVHVGKDGAQSVRRINGAKPNSAPLRAKAKPNSAPPRARVKPNR